MALPDVSLTVKDGQTGILADNADGLQVKVGVCSAGPTNTLAFYASKDDLIAVHGTGPAVEAACLVIELAGTVGFMRCTASVAGSNSAVTKTAIGTSTGTITLAGTPLDYYLFRLKITKTGALGVAEFQYSLDDGDTYSDVTLVPSGGTFAITGFATLTFVPGAGPVIFEAGDIHEARSTAPLYNSSDLGAALDALHADVREWAFFHVVGPVDAALATVIGSKLTAMETAYRFVRGICEVRDQNAAEALATWQSAVNTDFASFVHRRVNVCAGYAEMVSPVSGRIYRRPIAWQVAARASAAVPSEDLGRFATGPMPGVTKLWHDERVSPAFDSTRFTTARTYLGSPGFYITHGRLMSPTGSDFKFWQYGRVMDKGCRAARNALLLFLNETFRVSLTTGFIDEGDARAVDAVVTRAILDEVGADASGGEFSTYRNINMISTQKLAGKASIVPFAYGKAVEAEIGFTNPALNQVA